MERPQAMTAVKFARREILFRLRPVRPANLILALAVLFVVQLVFYALWAWLVERFSGSFGGSVQPAVASVSCSLTAFFTTIHSRPAGRWQGFAACAVACLSALAVAGGITLATLAARAAFPEFSDGFPVQLFVIFIGFWAGAPIMFSAALRLGMRPVNDEDKGTWPWETLRALAAAVLSGTGIVWGGLISLVEIAGENTGFIRWAVFLGGLGPGVLVVLGAAFIFGREPVADGEKDVSEVNDG